MNITEILKIADWNIAHTGNSHLETGPISGQNKYVLVDDYMVNDSCYYTVHFNKSTDEVLAIVIDEIHERNRNTVTIYAVEPTMIADFISEFCNNNLKSNPQVTIIRDVGDIIDKLNKLHGREPDSMVEIESLSCDDLALIDQAAHQAGLTRNGYLTKIIVAGLQQ